MKSAHPTNLRTGNGQMGVPCSLTALKTPLPGNLTWPGSTRPWHKIIPHQLWEHPMLRDVHFDGPGRLTGVVNTLKSFHLLRPHSTFLHHLAHRVRSARMTGGVGQIGSRAMPGSVHGTCTSPWLGFLHTSPHTLEQERASTEQLTALFFPPNSSAGRRSFVPFSFLHHAFSKNLSLNLALAPANDGTGEVQQ